MSVRRTKDNITPNNKSIQKQLDKLPRQAYDVFYDNTPIKTGNARRNTKLVRGDTIQARYAYAQRLDEGSSKQSPKGMVKPTEDFIKDRLDQIFGSTFRWRT